MKKMKKIMAMIMAMAMVLGMSLTTLAEENAKINVVGLPTDVQTTLTYVKIAEPDTTSTAGWKYVNSLTGTAVIDNGKTGDERVVTELGGVTIQQLLALEADTNAESGTINSSELIKNVTAAVNIPATPEVKTQGTTQGDVTTYAPTATIEGITPGLYVVKAQATGWTFIEMLAYVPYDTDNNAKSVILRAKGAEDQIRKTADKNTVNEGDIVTYTITTQYPFYPVGAPNKFTIADSVENAKYVVDKNANPVVVGKPGITVKIGGKVVTEKETVEGTLEKTNYTITWSAATGAGDSFNIDFNYDITKAGQDVEITYAVKVGNLSDGKQLKNTVSQETEEKITKEELTANSVTFKVIKEGENNSKLTGAEFTLYVANENGNVDLTVDTGAKDDDGKPVTKIVKANVVTTTDSEGNVSNVTVTTEGDEGANVFEGLDATKTYYVKETIAPTGYSLNDLAYELKGAELDEEKSVIGEKKTEAVGNKEVTTITTTYVYKNFNDQTVVDTKLSALPSTGGIGTTIFTIGGVAIMVVAAGLFFATRKKASK